MIEEPHDTRMKLTRNRGKPSSAQRKRKRLSVALLVRTRQTEGSQFGQVSGQAATRLRSAKASSARLSLRHAVASGLRLAISSGRAGSRRARPGASTRP